jgi:hypothetical protein
MKLATIFKGLVVGVAILGICLPQSLLASTPVKQSAPVVDVALGQGGKLLGQVVDTNGAVESNVPVSLRQGDRELAKAKADANGYFAFSGLRGGVYQVVAAKGVASYRVWAQRTAPPTAQKGALVVSGQNLMRGQYHHGHGRFGVMKSYLANPWVVAGIVATAVAVPVGIHNSSSSSSPSSP